MFDESDEKESEMRYLRRQRRPTNTTFPSSASTHTITFALPPTRPPTRLPRQEDMELGCQEMLHSLLSPLLPSPHVLRLVPHLIFLLHSASPHLHNHHRHLLPLLHDPDLPHRHLPTERFNMGGNPNPQTIHSSSISLVNHRYNAPRAQQILWVLWEQWTVMGVVLQGVMEV